LVIGLGERLDHRQETPRIEDRIDRDIGPAERDEMDPRTLVPEDGLAERRGTANDMPMSTCANRRLTKSNLISKANGISMP